MATQQYVNDESFEFLGTTDGGSPAKLSFYNGALISPSNPVPAYTAVMQTTSASGVTGSRCVLIPAATYAYGQDAIGLTQEPVTSPNQIVRVRTLGISKARTTAVAVAAGDHVAVATGASLGQVKTLAATASATKAANVYYYLGVARTLGGGTANELIEVNVNPIAV